MNVNALRPYAGFASIQEEEDVANSKYNGLQVQWNRRFANGFSFGFAYTFSKSTDNSSNYRDIVPDTYNTSNLWGPSEFDTRHAVVISYVYDLPFFKGQKDLAGNFWADGRSAASTSFRPERLAASGPATTTPAWAKSGVSDAAAKVSSGP